MKTKKLIYSGGSIEYLTEPYSIDDIRALVDDNKMVTGIVQIHLSDIVDGDLESFLDILSEKLFDSVLLMGLNYDIVGCDSDNNLYIEVTGEVEISDDLLEAK